MVTFRPGKLGVFRGDATNYFFVDAKQCQNRCDPMNTMIPAQAV